MIRHKSTEKRARQNKKRYQSNRAIKSSVKTGVKNLLAVLETKNKEGSTSQLKKVISTLNKAKTDQVRAHHFDLQQFFVQLDRSFTPLGSLPQRLLQLALKVVIALLQPGLFRKGRLVGYPPAGCLSLTIR